MKLDKINCFAFFAHFAPQELWRFAVDGQKQSTDGLVRWEAREPGSIRSLLNAYASVFNNTLTKQTISVEDILKIHAISMGHISGTVYNNGLSRKTLTQQPLDFIQPGGRSFFITLVLNHNLSLAGAAELQQHLRTHPENNISLHLPTSEKSISRPTEMPDEFKRFYLLEHPSMFRRNNQGIIRYWAVKPKPEYEEYIYHLIENELQFMYMKLADDQLSDDEKFLIIIRTVQYLSRIHPFPDGNTRTFAVVFLNIVLMQHNYLPTILSNPNEFEGYCAYELLEAVKAGMRTTLTLMLSIEKTPPAQRPISLWSNENNTAYLHLKNTIEKAYPVPPELPRALPAMQHPYCWFTSCLKDTPEIWHGYILKHSSPPLAHHIIRSLRELNILDILQLDIRAIDKLISHCAPHGVMIVATLCYRQKWPISVQDIINITSHSNPYSLLNILNDSRIKHLDTERAYQFFSNTLVFSNPLDALEAFCILLNHKQFNVARLEQLKASDEPPIELAKSLVKDYALPGDRDNNGNARNTSIMIVDDIFSIDVYSEVLRLASHNLLAYARYQTVVNHPYRNKLVSCLIIIHSFQFAETTHLETMINQHSSIELIWEALVEFERIMPEKPFTKEVLTFSLQTSIPYLAAILWEHWDDGVNSYLTLLSDLNSIFDQEAFYINHAQIKLIINKLKLGNCLTAHHIPIMRKIFTHDSPLEISIKAVHLQKLNRLLITDNFENALLDEVNEIRIENF